MNPNAAGIDVGGASHYVAVPADRDDQPVREFAAFTGDLYRMEAEADEESAPARYGFLAFGSE